jgi:hypothetical protein
MSADQHKQIGILRGEISFSMRTGFMKQNQNFEKIAGVQIRENLKTPWLFLVRS